MLKVVIAMQNQVRSTLVHCTDIGPVFLIAKYIISANSSCGHNDHIPFKQMYKNVTRCSKSLQPCKIRSSPTYSSSLLLIAKYIISANSSCGHNDHIPFNQMYKNVTRCSKSLQPCKIRSGPIYFIARILGAFFNIKIYHKRQQQLCA